MKIAIIGQKGIPARFGGVERHVEDLAVLLVERGLEVLAYTRPNYTPENSKSYKGVELVSIPSLPTKHLDAITHTFLAILDLAFRRRDVDIVHFHSIGPSSLIWLVKLLRPRLPIIATFHTQCYHHGKWGGFARGYLKFGERMICSLPNRTITVSRGLFDYVKKMYNGNFVYIPNGVARKEQVELKEVVKWGLEKDGYFLVVSRLVRHKGIHHVIKAYNRLKTDKKLVIVGASAFTDDYIKELLTLAAPNQKIIFTDNQAGRTLEELFSNAYLFVQPSESEGLSIALLEAMAYNLPVVSSDIPENLEVIENAGIIFENKNVDDLIVKLIYCLENPEVLAKKKALALKKVLTEYDWEKIVDKIVLEYEKVLEVRRDS